MLGELSRASILHCITGKFSSMRVSPSQRLKMIKVIADRLSTEAWPLIDITLRQFSIPTNDNWHGDRHSYVLSMIAEVPDDPLIELARHVGYQFDEPVTPRLEPPFWQAGMFRLFVSHLAKYRKFAGELQEALATYGISAFVAHNDIEPTSEWLTQIETALATCDALVALMHPEFHASNWTDQEIRYCMGRGVPVYSVRLGQDPYGFIGRFQAFDGFSKSPEELARELFDSYRTKKDTQRKMASALVNLFEHSANFHQAKQRIAFLEELDSWDSTFSARIQSAAATNSQIRRAWGVPARVDALVAKWGEIDANHF